MSVLDDKIVLMEYKLQLPFTNSVGVEKFEIKQELSDCDNYLGSQCYTNIIDSKEFNQDFAVILSSLKKMERILILMNKTDGEFVFNECGRLKSNVEYHLAEFIWLCYEYQRSFIIHGLTMKIGF
jgi:hypothetical protein